MLRGFVFVLFYLALFFVIFFVAAGTIEIPMAWIALGCYAAISIINFFLVDPELIPERLQMGGEGVSQIDRVVATVSFVFIYPLTLIVAGLDVGRYHWTQSYAFLIQIIALLLYCFGNLFGRWAMVSNKYFSTFVRIQEDRDHKVESGGSHFSAQHRFLCHQFKKFSSFQLSSAPSTGNHEYRNLWLIIGRYWLGFSMDKF